MGQASGLLMWMTRPHKAEAAQLAASFSFRTTSTVWRVSPAPGGSFCGAIGALHCPLASKGEGGTQRTLQTIEWNAYPFQIPPAKERLLLIVSAAGQPPSLKLIGKSEVAIGYWTGDAFRVVGFLRPRLSSDWRPAVTHWARLAPCLPQAIDLVRDRRFDPDVRD